jgi:hypothetical protein
MFLCPITRVPCADQECDIEGCREAAQCACAICAHCGAVHISPNEPACCDVCSGVQFMLGGKPTESSVGFGVV